MPDSIQPYSNLYTVSYIPEGLWATGPRPEGLKASYQVANQIAIGQGCKAWHWAWRSQVSSEVVRRLFCSMISMQIYGHLFQMDIMDIDIFKKFKSRRIQKKNVYHNCLFRFDWVMIPRGSTMFDTNCRNWALKVLRYLNCVHELCGTATAAAVDLTGMLQN